jgi:HSP20 family protein
MALRELIPWKRKELFAGKEANPFDSLQREMARIFDRFTHGFGGDELAKREEWWGSAFPAVDIAETDKEILVTAELPGLDEKDLDVSLRGNHLYIRGEKKAEKEEKGEHYYHKESSYGAFHRAIHLPVEVEEDKIEATYKKGVLKITLPKSAEALKTRKKISIH